MNIIILFNPASLSLAISHGFFCVHSFTDRMFCVIADYGKTMCGHCSSLSKIQLKKILYVFIFDWCMYSIQPSFKELNFCNKIIIVQEVFSRCFLKTSA